MKTDRRVVMIQQGARRNYVYAQHLEQAGLLHTLATDAAWCAGGKSLLSPVLRRLAPRRRITSIAPERVVSTALPHLVSAVAKHVALEERVYPWIEEALALTLKSRRLSDVDVVINYLGNGGSFLDHARMRGANIATDFIIPPDYLARESDERERWPDWERGRISRSMIDFYRRRMSHLVGISDVYLCPSPTVARDLAGLDGFDPARVRLVPYGISGVLLKTPTMATGRVLFAGAAGPRKGIPYLAEAARILKKRAPGIEVVVAGAVTDAIRSRPETRALTFLGKLGRDAMADEMARADVFCLPSLAEGSATSVFEAMANALPTITTASSGTMVEHGVDGLIVPERDGGAIADAVETIVTDRTLRAQMSNAARLAAERYSDEACGARFIEVIRELLAARDAATTRPFTARAG